MPDQKEVQRLLGFAREHARAALTKPEVQRESYLAFCRLNFKRYAAGICKSAAEAERFAAALDHATRDIMVEMQDSASAQHAENVSPWYPLRDDAVTYDDGVKATKDQEAKDVAAFLAWAAEPHADERKQMGFSVMIYLLIFAGILYASYKRIWRNVGH